MSTIVRYTEVKNIQWLNGTGSAVASNALVLIGSMCVGVVQEDIANGAYGSVLVHGVVDVPKSGSAGPTFSQGDAVYVDVTNQVAKNQAAGGVFVGWCERAAGASGTYVRTKLAPLGDAPGFWVAAATGAQSVPAGVIGGAGAVIEVPNTAALAVTLPELADVPLGAIVDIVKTSSDAEAVTVSAGGSDNIRGTVGTIDAQYDRVTLRASLTGWLVITNTIA